jgi:hypothetical protein
MSGRQEHSNSSRREREMKTPKQVREREPNERGETGAEGKSDAARKPPAAPDGHDRSPVGDTDQHSRADA